MTLSTNWEIRLDQHIKQMHTILDNDPKEDPYPGDYEPLVDRKDVTGKPLPLLMPYEALVAYSKVSDYGQKKYGNRDSWKHSTSGVETYTNAAARHLYKSQDEQVDEESHLSHLHHALWSLCAAVWHLERQSK